MKLGTVVLSRLFIVFLFVFLACGRNSFGQTLHSELQRIPITGKLNSGSVLSCVAGETIYFMPTYTQAPERVVYSVGSDGLPMETLTIKKRGKKGLGNERIVRFEILEKKLIILSNESIHFYKRSGNQFLLEKSINNRYSFSGMEKLGNTLLLHVCYAFHPLDQKETNVWAKLDLTKQEIGEIHFPEIDNTQFGYFVNSWVSTYEGTIAHASTTEYKIVFYNEFYKPVDSIVRNEKLFGVDTIAVNNRSLYSKEGIADFMSLDEEKFTRIRKVFLLDHHRLIVLSRLSKDASPPHGKARLDVWEKNASGWEIKNQVLGDDMYRDGEAYDDQHVFLGNLYQNVFDLKISNGQIYSVSFPYHPKVTTRSFDRVKDMDEYFKDATEFNYGLEKFVFGTN